MLKMKKTMSKKRPVNKDTKTYRAKIIKRLKNKLLKLWSIKVKERAGNCCEVDGCETGNALNSHHIENYMVNPSLRYDIKNGICVCASHHKFLAQSAHKSFVFMYNLMLSKHPEELKYLLEYKSVKEELTIEKLEQMIKEMEQLKFDVQPQPAVQN